MIFILHKALAIILIVLIVQYNEAAQNESTIQTVKKSDPNRNTCFAHIKRRRPYTYCYYCCSKSLYSKYCYCDLVAMDYCRQDWLPVLRKLPDFDCVWNVQAYRRSLK